MINPCSLPCFSEPADRSPLKYPYGLFIVDARNFGGAQGFVWFNSESAALDYLRNELWQLYDFGEHDDASALANVIGTALSTATTLKTLPRGALNAAQDAFELRWAGTLEDLLVGSEPFEGEIQHNFRENVYGEERGLGPSDLHDFAQHLLNYHG